MSKKSVKRLDSKKKKAAAFIQLIKSDENYRESKLNMKEDRANQDGGAASTSAGSRGKQIGGMYQPKGSGKQRSISDEMFVEYKKIMREKQKAAMAKPKVFLTLNELAHDDPIQTDLDEVKVAPPLFMADVQHLLLYALLGLEASIKPRWCRLVRVGKVCKVVAVVLDSVSSEEFKKFPESLPTLVQAFDMQTEMVSPLQYGSSAREDIMNVPISITQLKEMGLLTRMSGKGDGADRQSDLTKHSLRTKNERMWAVAKTLKTLVENPLKRKTVDEEDVEVSSNKRLKTECVDSNNDGIVSTYKMDRDEEDVEVSSNKRLNTECVDSNNDGIVSMDRDEEDVEFSSNKRLNTECVDSNNDDIVSTYKMDSYDRRWLMLNSAQMICESIPTPIDIANRRYQDYVFSKDTYEKVTNKSPLFAIDCEMVQTRASMMDLGRVSLIDENLGVVYDTFVKPWAPITNYVTQFSGITKEIMDGVMVRLQDVQAVMRKHLPPDAILCGQSICGDLSSMKLFHPYIIDTSVIYNLSGDRRFKTGLKRLSAMFLRKLIQNDAGGHSSVEDAQATMELVLLKLRNSLEFGDMLMTASNAMNSTTSPDMSENFDKDNESTNKDASDHSEGGKPVSKLRNPTTTNAHENTTTQDDDDNTGTNNDSVNCSNLTRTLVTVNDERSDIQRRRLFFQQQGGKFIENFLKRINKQRKQGAVMDIADCVSLYPKTMSVVTCDSDKDIEKQTVMKTQEVDFCFSHLHSYKNHLRETQGYEEIDEKIKKCLWKLDRHFWKIMIGLPSNSLFVVILPGREDHGTIHPAMTFAKIT